MYAKSSEPISIVLTDSENEILDPDALCQHTRTWSEVVKGKVAGIYELMAQGSQIVSMSYTTQSNGKECEMGTDHVLIMIRKRGLSPFFPPHFFLHVEKPKLKQLSTNVRHP
ncbi:hypothetical protein [Pseudomonas sp. NPDC087817]|uniref:hypothetical protein n=1 Tax=Pseudomonas sp. NPDC087817 TaxID=3364451 RepID=UPI00381A5095